MFLGKSRHLRCRHTSAFGAKINRWASRRRTTNLRYIRVWRCGLLFLFNQQPKEREPISPLLLLLRLCLSSLLYTHTHQPKYFVFFSNNNSLQPWRCKRLNAWWWATVPSVRRASSSPTPQMLSLENTFLRYEQQPTLFNFVSFVSLFFFYHPLQKPSSFFFLE